VHDDLIKRGLRHPKFHIAARIEKAVAGVWDRVPMQRRTVHKHGNLLVPERLCNGIT
jgi:hypothetical protein